MSNGWHILTANTTIPPNTDVKITIDVLEKEIILSVNGKTEKQVALAVELSGKTIYIGDNPEDDGWGDKYNIHPAMIGEVQLLQYGTIPKEMPPSPTAAKENETKPEAPSPTPPAEVVSENKPEPPPPSVPSAASESAVPTEPTPTNAPAEGIKEIGKALDSGVVQTAVGAITPSARKKYEAIFNAHPEAMKRVAALLADAKLKYTQGRYSEYEFTDKGRNFTIVLEKIGDRWYLAQL